MGIGRHVKGIFGSKQQSQRDQLVSGNGQPVPSTPMVADRMGRKLDAKQVVLYHAMRDLIFEIVSVDAAMDPRMPPGTVIVKLRTEIQLAIPNGVASEDIVIVKMPPDPPPAEPDGVQPETVQ